jgi:hypothetical protein
MFREEGIAFPIRSPLVVMLCFLGIRQFDRHLHFLFEISFCDGVLEDGEFQWCLRVTRLFDRCLENDLLRLACLLQIRLSFANLELPGSVSREYGRCVHGFWKNQGSLVVQLVTNILPTYWTSSFEVRIWSAAALCP